MQSLDPLHVVTPDPEPAYCPRCGLRHTRRPDWMCPRCGSPVETEVPAPAKAPAPAADPRTFPLGARIAGGLLVLTSGALAFAATRGFAVIPPGAHRWRLLAIGVALAGLGAALLLKASLARWAAVACAAVGVVILLEGLVRDLSPGLVRDPLPAAGRQLLRDLIRDHQPRKLLSLLGFHAGGLLLLIGRPRPARIAAGALLALPLLVALVLAGVGR